MIAPSYQKEKVCTNESFLSEKALLFYPTDCLYRMAPRKVSTAFVADRRARVWLASYPVIAKTGTAIHAPTGLGQVAPTPLLLASSSLSFILVQVLPRRLRSIQVDEQLALLDGIIGDDLAAFNDIMLRIPYTQKFIEPSTDTGADVRSCFPGYKSCQVSLNRL